MGTKLRDLIGVIEIAGRWISEEQLDAEIRRWYRIAGEGRRQSEDVNRSRAERDDLGVPTTQSEP